MSCNSKFTFFHFDWGAAYGTCTSLTPTSGTIQSLRTSYINCLYTINASPGSKIKLTFSKFIVDNNNDFVTAS
jgi:hypothetical protein